MEEELQTSVSTRHSGQILQLEARVKSLEADQQNSVPRSWLLEAKEEADRRAGDLEQEKERLVTAPQVALEVKITRLVEELHRFRSENRALVQRELDQDSLLASLRDQANLSEDQIDTMQRTISTLEDALKTAERDRKEALEQHTVIAAREQELRSMCEELEAQVASRQEQLDAALGELALANSKLAQRSSAVLELRKGVEALHSSYRVSQPSKSSRD